MKPLKRLFARPWCIEVAVETLQLKLLGHAQRLGIRRQLPSRWTDHSPQAAPPHTNTPSQQNACSARDNGALRGKHSYELSVRCMCARTSSRGRVSRGRALGRGLKGAGCQLQANQRRALIRGSAELSGAREAEEKAGAAGREGLAIEASCPTRVLVLNPSLVVGAVEHVELPQKWSIKELMGDNKVLRG